MLSSVSSGLLPTPLAPSGDAMAGGRAEPVGHSSLQKGGRPQLTPPLQICSLKSTYGWEVGKPRQGLHCALLWRGRLAQPRGTPLASCTPSGSSPKGTRCRMSACACRQLPSTWPTHGPRLGPAPHLHKARSWMDTGGGRGKAWEGRGFGLQMLAGGRWHTGRGEQRWPGWSCRLCEPSSSSSSLSPCPCAKPRGKLRQPSWGRPPARREPQCDARRAMLLRPVAPHTPSTPGPPPRPGPCALGTGVAGALWCQRGAGRRTIAVCPGTGGRLQHRWLPASRAMPSGFETKHPCWGWGPCLRAWWGGSGGGWLF